MEYFQKKYALSRQGAKDLQKGILYSILANISLMLPVVLLAYVLDAFLTPLLNGESFSGNIWMYILLGIIILAVIYMMHYLQRMPIMVVREQSSNRWQNIV